ncbi:MAG: glycosyltransferase family 2 protein [Planctomycetota bacterium]
MRITAVVVNWNGGAANVACLAVLQGAALAQIVFVDNASSDGSLELVRESFPCVEILRNDANLGFGEASNLGAKRAVELGCDALLFVNNDVLLRPNELEKLVRELERDPSLGFVGPRVLDARDPTRIWAAGGKLSWRQNLTTLIGQGEPDGQRFHATRDVDYVVGCALLARREAFENASGFDGRYFAYSEDVDLALRAKRLGGGSRVVGEACALHLPSSSTGGGYNPRRKYMMGVNSIWFLREHAKPRHWISFFVFDVASLPFVGLLELSRGRGRAVLAKALGIFHGLRGRRVDARALEAGGTFLW